MKVITLLNEKGGVGKTTLATTLAAGLAIRGYRVMLMDTDMQANATIAFGLTKEPCFYDFIKRGSALPTVIRRIAEERIYSEPIPGMMYVMPGNDENMHLPNSVSDAEVVLKAVRPLEDVVDYIIFDTSPSQTLFHVAVYIATDYILYPTHLEEWSIHGVMEAWQRRIAANAVRNGYHMKAIEVVGIQPVATNMQTVLHQEKYEGLRHQFGDKVLAPIAKRSAWAEAAAMGMSIFAYDPTSKAATEAWQIVNAVEAMEVSYD